ncbi:MAG: helix-turn-helix domain-containing protein [Oscillospiraceae bacterium]|nr:helix-turn-helix domain-containing protein [Oscillospiraceae bacterium]
MDWFENLRSLKAASGMSMREIAVKSRIPEPTLEKIFSGATKSPGVNTIQSLVHALGYTLDDLDSGLNKNPPSTDESAPGGDLQQEIIHLAGKLSSEQKDFFLALLRLTAARNQGLSAADLVSAGEAALKSERQNPTR